jgi:uncharacterized protein
MQQPAGRWPLLLLALGLPATGMTASFDCKRATNAADRAVCADRGLSALDEQLARAYKRFISVSPQPYADQLSQMNWLAKRDACPDRACLEASYRARLTELYSQSKEWYVPAAGGEAQVPVASPPPVCAALRSELEWMGRTAFSRHGPVHRYRDVNYAVDIGDQEATVYAGEEAEGRVPVCTFKRRWTEDEKRAAYAVLKRYPDLLQHATILRPEKEANTARRQIWNVQFRCEHGGVHAQFNVEPRTYRVRPVIAPGGEGSSRCEAQKLALQDLPVLTPTAGNEWIGLP